MKARNMLLADVETPAKPFVPEKKGSIKYKWLGI
jgi:hypothetical protein